MSYTVCHILCYIVLCIIYHILYIYCSRLSKPTMACSLQPRRSSSRSCQTRVRGASSITYWVLSIDWCSMVTCSSSDTISHTFPHWTSPAIESDRSPPRLPTAASPWSLIVRLILGAPIERHWSPGSEAHTWMSAWSFRKPLRRVRRLGNASATLTTCDALTCIN